MLTDTHTHLYSDAFEEDRRQVVQKAMESGVGRFFLPAIDSTYTEGMLQLQSEFPDAIFPMIGLHPVHVNKTVESELDHVRKMLKKHKFYAVGEIGMDLYWDKQFLSEQEMAFEYQIRLAKSNELPIVIHCRDAFDEVFTVLEREADEKLRGIFHCFTGSLQQAERAISLGMKLGIGGVVTYKNGKIDAFLDQIGIEHIVLETDSPYLSPTPLRGKRNESANLVHIADKVAEIYGITREEIARITTENSREVFGI